MRNRRAVAIALFALCMIAPRQVAAQHHEHTGKAPEKLGTVQFATSCNAQAQPRFNRGVALLHSFWFKAAIEEFRGALAKDVHCAMAHWAIALSLWGNPFAPKPYHSEATVREAWSAVQRAGELKPPTEREADYVAAIAELWRDAASRDARTRLNAYAEAMERVSTKHAEDREARIFYAVALAASAAPTDKTYAKQLKAGGLLEGIFGEMPDHPGVAHYIIHSYDVPALAHRGLDAASKYAKIAPASAHALHMPSHTFTRVGHWQESIDTNEASARAAKRDGCTAEELHAMDYQAYAYMQTGQEQAMKRTLAALPAVVKRLDPKELCGAAPGSAGLFAAAAIPARYALERGAWEEATSLAVRTSDFAYADAPTHFARALGFARTKKLAEARQEIGRLEALRDRLTTEKDLYWAGQVEIQRQGAAAWVAYAEGRAEEAIALMRKAADAEDATEKAAVTPGPLAPARELLGEMLLESGNAREALTAFETTLKKEPNRFRALYGAGRAAEAAGERAKAAGYYRELVTVTARGNAARPELQHARKFVEGAKRAGA